MNKDITEYLLSGEEWLRYAVRINLLKENKDTPRELRRKVLSDPKIQGYLKDAANFENFIVSTHKNPELPAQKLLFLLDIGLDTSVSQMKAAVEAILRHKDNDGVYQSPVNIPKHFGGSGEDTFGWCLCDAPFLLLALIKAGVPYEAYCRRGVEHLISFYQNGAFPCVVSRELGKFRGPGRKDDCCPYATLAMLKLFAAIPAYQNSKIANECVRTLLSFWEHSHALHPYLFFMGTDFRKPKAPAIWYDIVSVCGCLRMFEATRTDARFMEMLSVLQSRRDENGLFTPESVYQKCKDWDFGQKKTPSPYLTYLCTQILEGGRE